MPTTPVSIDCGDPPDGTVGAFYSHQMPLSGGDLPLTVSIDDGALPDGLSIDNNALITGTPTVAGTFSFEAIVFDSGEGRAWADCSITITEGSVSIGCADPPSGTVGVSYSHQLSLSGGEEPLTMAVFAPLPPMEPSGTGHAAGAVPDPGGTAGSSRFLREDATWEVPASSQTGTRAVRLALDPTLYANVEFYESDTTLLYVSDGSHWIWKSGTYSRTFTQVAAFAATLGIYDAGLLMNVSDFGHILQWSGTVWAAAPGEKLGGYFVSYYKAPTETGWQLADGSVTTYLDILTTLTVTPASPTVLNISNATQVARTVIISGATGAWTGLNGSWVVSACDASTITIPFNSSSKTSPITGAPLLSIGTVLPDLRP